MIKIIKMSDNTKDFIEAFYKILEEMKTAMENAPLSKSIAQNYISRMIPHHEASILMTENILKYTTDVEIENLAKTSMENDKKHIQMLRSVFDECNEPSSERDLFLYEKIYNDAFNKMFQTLSSTPSGNNLNANFLYEMIPMTEGAINMTKNLLKFEICENLRTIAEELLMVHQVSLDQMKGMLRKY